MSPKHPSAVAAPLRTSKGTPKTPAVAVWPLRVRPAILYARLGERDKALEIAARLEELESSEPAAAYMLGLIHCLLGNLELAVEWLERLEQAGSGTLYCPRLRGFLRSSSRVAPLPVSS
jgi:tetratricopeptide (TPR) repeat protein